MVLKLALLASHMAETLIENLRKTSECDVMFDKHRRQTLAVALFNLCYVFYIVFVKRIKWCIVPHIIVQMDLPVDGVCINSPKTRLVCAIGWGKKLCAVEANLPTYYFEEHMFVISPSMARSVGYDMKSVRLTEDAIPTIFDKLGNAKPKRISSLMEKLNRKRVCMSDNRVILGANYWTFTSSRIRE